MSTFISSTLAPNPTYLPPRYEIRQLTLAHIPWASAMVSHSNLFYSPIWSIVYPENKTQRLHTMMRRAQYLVSHQIASGMSFGVFDKEYKFKRAESAATAGALYWNELDTDADAATLLTQMDFPLASVALAYDGSEPLDMQRLMPLIESLPLFATYFSALDESDKRDPASWKPTGPQEVLMRNATSTRADYEGQGLMKKLAQWLMREANGKGYRAIQIDCAHDTVTRAWLHPQEPFTAQMICGFDTEVFEQADESGKKIKPFQPSKQVVTRIYVTL